jgi:hypothetical protein
LRAPCRATARRSSSSSSGVHEPFFTRCARAAAPATIDDDPPPPEDGDRVVVVEASTISGVVGEVWGSRQGTGSCVCVTRAARIYGRVRALRLWFGRFPFPDTTGRWWYTERARACVSQAVSGRTRTAAVSIPRSARCVFSRLPSRVCVEAELWYGSLLVAAAAARTGGGAPQHCSVLFHIVTALFYKRNHIFTGCLG